MASSAFALVAILALLAGTQAQQNFATNQLSTSALGERAQRALFLGGSTSPFVLPVATGLPTANIVDNAAARQLQADKSAFPFLATLPNQGSAAFITMLRPCGIIQPHVHPRATEQYVIISGSMQGGVAQEAGGAQNLTFTVSVGQSFVVPQGLVHFNTNRQCTPNVFVQTFNSADPGTIPLVNALSALRSVDPGTLSSVGLSTVNATAFGAFALDTDCLARCGLTAAGGGNNGLSTELQQFLGIAALAPTASQTVLVNGSTSTTVTTSTSGSTTTSTTIAPSASSSG